MYDTTCYSRMQTIQVDDAQSKVNALYNSNNIEMPRAPIKVLQLFC